MYDLVTDDDNVIKLCMDSVKDDIISKGVNTGMTTDKVEYADVDIESDSNNFIDIHTCISVTRYSSMNGNRSQ